MESDAFFQEAYELLDEIENTLMRLKDDPADAELLNRLFRAFHTIKGSGAMFGFQPIADFTHKIETAIDQVRQGKAPFSEHLLELTLASRDHLLAMLEAANMGTAFDEEQAQPLVRSLENFVTPSPPGLATKADVGKQTAREECINVPNQTPQRAIQDSPKKVLNKLRMLIVEDEYISRFLLQEILHPYGICHVAIDGYEAITAIKKALVEDKPYQVICLDIMMPGIDGRKVAEEIRRLEADLGCLHPSKIVITSGLSPSAAKMDSNPSAYYNAYLVKPINPAELLEIIHDIAAGG